MLPNKALQTNGNFRFPQNLNQLNNSNQVFIKKRWWNNYYFLHFLNFFGFFKWILYVFLFIYLLIYYLFYNSYLIFSEIKRYNESWTVRRKIQGWNCYIVDPAFCIKTCGLRGMHISKFTVRMDSGSKCHVLGWFGLQKSWVFLGFGNLNIFILMGSGSRTVSRVRIGYQKSRVVPLGFEFSGTQTHP